jgi:hypothetical protein
MAILDKDYGRIAMPVPAAPACAIKQSRHFLGSKIFA